MNTTKPDGGQAFPWLDADNPHPGMGLRDWFAGMALQGMAASEHWESNFDATKPEYLADVARAAYAAADSMIQQREK